MTLKRTVKSRRKRLNWLMIIAALALGGLAFAGGGGLVAADLENHDSFCASCHTQPESTFYERAQADGAVDLASAHAASNVKCIDCHSGSGAPGRLGAMLVGAGDLTAYWSGHYNNPAVVTVPIGDQNCLKCHAEVLTSRNFNNHFHYFLPEWKMLDPQHAAGCVGCHQGHTTGGRRDVAFLDEAATTHVCKSCHAAAGEGR